MNVSGIAAFVAGLLSFVSPCVLPLVPSYLIYISGRTITGYSDLSSGSHKRAVILHSLTFIAGFSAVFVLLGLSSSLLGGFFAAYQVWIMRVGGVLLIIMGLNSVGVFKMRFLDQEKTLHLNRRPIGFLGSFLIGVTFSLGWTPCIGPVLASILLIASTSTALDGAYLLSLYSLGLALPFFAAGLLVDRLLGLVGRFGHVVQYTTKVVGVLLIAVGILFLTGLYGTLSQKLM